jgi:hypothetical protein
MSGELTGGGAANCSGGGRPGGGGHPLSPFEWTDQRGEAALLLAQDHLADWEIADKVCCSERILNVWKKCPEFAARIKQHVRQLGSAAARYAIGKLSRRLADLEAKWRKLNAVLEQRAADPDLATVPGGTTGLIVRRRRIIGTGEKQEIVDEYEVDVALLREIRETLKQAAIECGQWQQKADLASGGVPFKVYIGVDASKV